MVRNTTRREEVFPSGAGVRRGLPGAVTVRMLVAGVVFCAGGLLAGCSSGPPDAGGTWEITVPLVAAYSSDEGPPEGDLVVVADIRQLDGGGLEGNARTVSPFEGETCRYQVVSPERAAQANLDPSRVTDEGEVRLALQGECGPNVYFALQGQLAGDEMEGEAVRPVAVGTGTNMGSRAISASNPRNEPVYNTGPGRWSAARIPEGEARELERTAEQEELDRQEAEQEAREEYRREATREAEERAREQQDREDLRETYEEADAGLREMASDVEGRISALEDPEGDLGEELGPDSESPDTFACARSPVSCEVAELETKVERDRETFEAEGYGEAGCAANSPERFADYEDLDAGYLAERERIAGAAEGLEEDALATVEQAREAQAALEAFDPEVSGESLSIYRTVSEAELLVGEAADTEERAAAAIPAADERHAQYESRANAAWAEAEAIYARAGCAL